jgi:hypothetical protein
VCLVFGQGRFFFHVIKRKCITIKHTKNHEFIAFITQRIRILERMTERLREFVTKNNRVIKLEVLIYQSVQSYRAKKSSLLY